MNQNRAWAYFAVLLSILMHASIASLGNFQLNEAGSKGGSLSVTVAGHSNDSGLQSSQNINTDSVPSSENTPVSELNTEPTPPDPIAAETTTSTENTPVSELDTVPTPPDPIAAETKTPTEDTSASEFKIEQSTVPVAAKKIIRTEVSTKQEQTEELPTTKPVEEPKQLAEKKAKPVTERVEKAQAHKPVEQKTNPTASSKQAKMSPATTESQSAAASASPEGQEMNMSSMNQTGSTTSKATAGIGIVIPITPDVTAIPLYHLIPKPPYPSRARDHGEEGTVIIAILVSTDGSVADANITKSSGYPLLDGSALSTVKAKWRFKPATKNNKPVESWVRAPIHFSIY